MKICPNCGKELADDVKFCEKCGCSLEPYNQNQGVDPNAFQDGVAPQMQPGFNPNGQSFNQFAPQYTAFDPKDHTSDYDKRDIADNKIFATLAYIGFMGMIIALLVNNSPFARFHARNAAMIEVANIIAAVVFIVPFIGWIASPIMLIVLFIVRIVAFVRALKGKAIELPIVSDIGFLA
ncbi:MULTISPECIES: DUF4870 domain-containing protein [Butyrivibrio]|uniref:DUF4870 domain-containing protein n=1 Tax=Butyrivibrio TaxID=830 RepID=UPI00040B871F|nr:MULTISPECIES: zinc-ribbon domain-containing protein [Butyrivibrio]